MSENINSATIKLASIIVHYEEYLSNNGSPFDLGALESLRADEEVVELLDRMKSMALLPLKRGD